MAIVSAMKWLALIVFYICLVAPGAATLSMPRVDGQLPGEFSGQFSGLGKPDQRLVDLRIHFFARLAGGAPIAERRFQSVELVRGYFSVPIDSLGLTGRQLYAEIGLRPAGRRYAPYTLIRPRRAVQIDSRSLRRIWRLEPTTAAAHSMPLVEPFQAATDSVALGNQPIHLMNQEETA